MSDDTLRKEIFKLGQKLRDGKPDAAEIRHIGQELITRSGCPDEIKEFIPCPRCGGVNSITYDSGRPRACSTCHATGSIINPDWVELRENATLFESNVDLPTSQF